MSRLLFIGLLIVGLGSVPEPPRFLLCASGTTLLDPGILCGREDGGLPINNGRRTGPLTASGAEGIEELCSRGPPRDGGEAETVSVGAEVASVLVESSIGRSVVLERTAVTIVPSSTVVISDLVDSVTD